LEYILRLGVQLQSLDMLRLSLLALAAQFAKAARVAAPKVETFNGYKVLRAVPDNLEQLDMLHEWKFGEAGIDVDMWREPFAVGEAVVMMFNGKDVAKAESYLKMGHIQYKTTIDDVQQVIEEEKATLPRARASYSPNAFNRFEAISSRVNDLANSHSSVTKFDFGRSSEGRAIPGLKINVGGGSKPAAVVLCGIHSREWINPASCMYVVDRLLAGTASDDMYKFEWHIVPIAQPDGYVFTFESNRMWRKNRVETGGTFFKTYGVDINRNYEGTRCINYQERSKSSDSYCGPSAFSEVETRNIRDYMVGLQKKGQEIKIFLDVHAFSQMFLWPYGHTTSKPSDINAMNKCGNAAADAAASVYGTRWKRGPISTTIYAAGGSSVDWTYDALGIVHSYALELRDTGNYGFIAPTSEIEPSGRELLASFEALASCV
jgi:murein tripeptide amidase MpaA